MHCQSLDQGFIMHIAKESEEKMKYFEEFESFVRTHFPEGIIIHTLEVAHTKGNGRRWKRNSEQSSSTKQRKKKEVCDARHGPA